MFEEDDSTIDRTLVASQKNQKEHDSKLEEDSPYNKNDDQRINDQQQQQQRNNGQMSSARTDAINNQQIRNQAQLNHGSRDLLHGPRSQASLSKPTHRLQKRPVPILKNKKHQVGLRAGTLHHSASQRFWGAFEDQIHSNPDSPTNQRLGVKSKTISEINFFECREVTNCEFIYEQSDKNAHPSPGRGGGNIGLFDAISRMFTRSPSTGEITAMCAVKDLLALGFSNGVLILFDIDKLEIVFSHKHFTKNDKPIDKLKLFQMDNGTIEEQISILLSLSDGQLSYHRFPKITPIDELYLEQNIIDFQPYMISRRPFLATLHKSPKELKIFRLSKSLEYKYMTLVKLEQVPLAMCVYRDIFLITYRENAEYIRVENKKKDNETVTRFYLWQNNEPDQKFNPLPVFDESIQAFVITKEDYSFYMDLKGVYDREFNKIKWSDHVMHVEIVRPYLVGFLPNSIEIKNIFNPNRVVQKIELLQSTICRHTVAQNHICHRELDSMFILLNRKNSNIKVLLKMSQIDPRIQINMLIERKLYSTGLKFCDLLLENNFDGMTREQYDKLQREKGFYNFIIKHRYKIAKEIFKEYKVPLQQVILLFSEIYPSIFIQRLIEMFNINVKEIPYFDLQKQKELGVFEYQYKGSGANALGQNVNINQYVNSVQDLNSGMYLKNEIDADKLEAIREFLHYFIKKRQELIQKIEELSMLEKGVDRFYNHSAIDPSLYNPGEQYGYQTQILQGVGSQINNNQYMHQPNNRPMMRRMSLEGKNPYDEANNPFEIPVITDKRYHQSDNENVDHKISQLYYLRIMTEFFLFHSLILLIKSDEEQDKLILRNEFYQLIKNDNALPSDLCRDVFFNYQMYDEALLFLFYRREYKELLQLIQKEFEKNKTDKEKRNYWCAKFVKYCKKINDLGNEDIVMQHTDWIFKVHVDIGLECLKKQDKRNPFKSEKILRYAKDQGGLWGCLKYLEYLTMECNIEDRPIHTELGCLYVEYIKSFLQNYIIPSDQPNEPPKINREKADEDDKIHQMRQKLVTFFESSDYFEPQPILELMPQNYLTKERVMLLAKSKRYKEAFGICIDQLNDVDYAMTVAHRAYKWHRDKSIYFHIFVKLLQSGEREQAMTVLKNNFNLISFDKITNYISGDETFDINLNQFYQKAFVEMEKVSKELNIIRNLTQFEYYQRAEDLYNARNEYFIIKEDTECSKCSKKILQYPFYYLPQSKKIIHYYCMVNEQGISNNQSPRKHLQVSDNTNNATPGKLSPQSLAVK